MLTRLVQAFEDCGFGCFVETISQRLANHNIQRYFPVVRFPRQIFDYRNRLDLFVCCLILMLL